MASWISHRWKTAHISERLEEPRTDLALDFDPKVFPAGLDHRNIKFLMLIGKQLRTLVEVSGQFALVFTRYWDFTFYQKFYPIEPADMKYNPGLPGSGKSYLAESIASRRGAYLQSMIYLN